MGKGKLIIVTKAGTFVFHFNGDMDCYFEIADQIEAICRGLTDI